MKKILLNHFLLVIVIMVQSSLLLAQNETRTLVLKNDRGYGQATDWANLPLKEVTSKPAIAPDGSVFLADTFTHQILKFDSNGKLIKTFGQKGQGPGDLHYPNLCGILDGKYLVVGNLAVEKRISFFNMNCKFIFQIKTRQNCFRVLAFHKNRIVYLCSELKQTNAQKTWRKEHIRIFIKEIHGGLEKKLYQCELTDKSSITSPKFQGWATSVGNFSPRISMAVTANNHLLLGRTDSAEILVFNCSGEKLPSITLDLTPVPVTADFIRSFKKRTLAGFKERLRQKNIKSSPILPILNSYDFGNIFHSHFPLYKGLIPLPEGRFLVTLFRVCDSDQCPLTYRIFTANGSPQYNLRIDSGQFAFYGNKPANFHFSFSSNKLYTIVDDISGDETFMRMIRMPWASQ